MLFVAELEASKRSRTRMVAFAERELGLVVLLSPQQAARARFRLLLVRLLPSGLRLHRPALVFPGSGSLAERGILHGLACRRRRRFEVRLGLLAPFPLSLAIPRFGRLRRTTRDARGSRLFSLQTTVHGALLERGRWLHVRYWDVRRSGQSMCRIVEASGYPPTRFFVAGRAPPT